jgi:transcriptional regulator with XRE-family HTH domain
MSTKIATTNRGFWIDRLNDLQTSREINDTGIAKLLGVSRQWVSKWRSGQAQIPTMTKLRILDLLTYDKTRDSFFALIDDEIADKLRAADIERLNRKFGTNNDQEDA